MAGISGLANAALLAIVNAAAESAAANGVSLRLAVLFAITLALFIIAQRYLYERSALIAEGVVDNLRRRLAARIRDSELLSIEQLGKSVLYERLTREAAVLSEKQGTLIAALQSALLIVFAMIYMATLSIAALLLTIAVVIVGFFIYQSSEREATAAHQRAAGKEVEFLNAVTDEIDGFVELKMDRARARDMGDELDAVSRSVRDVNVEALGIFIQRYIFSQSFFLCLVGAIVFLLPRVVPAYGLVIQELATTILFIVGPLGNVVGAFPAWNKANVAMGNIMELEETLARGSVPAPPAGTVIPLAAPIRHIRVERAVFSYPDTGDGAFTVGPVDVEARTGEILFVVGGNGSGKSTLLKMLIGLYPFAGGRLLADGREVGRGVIEAYREQFNVILNDFHLFRRLYGIDLTTVQPRFEGLLREMHLERKTALVDGRFTTLDLSTGQRKRLALAIALLWDRPFYVFDEWAADQDPEFREHFYNVILPRLKSEGRGVIAVTHDDRYFHLADRIIRMEYGTMSPADQPPPKRKRPRSRPSHA